MSSAEIRASLREIANPREVRRQGRVPAVVYGHGDHVALEVDAIALEKLAGSAQARGLIDLLVEGESSPDRVMLWDVQRDPVKGDVLHADFYRVSMTEKITATVRIHLVGEPDVGDTGAVVWHGLREMEVECLPGAIPEIIEVDISQLEPGDSLTVEDLEMPEGVEAVTDLGTVVVSLVIPREEEEPEEEPEELEVELVGAEDAQEDQEDQEEASPEEE